MAVEICRRAYELRAVPGVMLLPAYLKPANGLARLQGEKPAVCKADAMIDFLLTLDDILGVRGGNTRHWAEPRTGAMPRCQSSGGTLRVRTARTCVGSSVGRGKSTICHAGVFPGQQDVSWHTPMAGPGQIEPADSPVGASRRIAAAKDILVFSRQEAERWRDARQSRIGRAMHEGGGFSMTPSDNKVMEYEHSLATALPATYDLLLTSNLTVHPAVSRIVLHGSRGLAGGCRPDSDIDLSLIVETRGSSQSGLAALLRDVAETAIRTWRAAVEADLAVVYDVRGCGLLCFDRTEWEEGSCAKGGRDCFGLYKTGKGCDGFVTNVGVQVKLMYPCLKIWQRERVGYK